MPKQVGKSGLLAKMGDKLRTAHEAHKTDDTTYSAFGDLPAGISGGVARLVEAKFDQYKKGENKGEWFFYVAGVCITPKEFEGQRCEGLRTSITEPLHETPGRARESVGDHVAFIYNELRKLGVDTSGMEFDDLEATVEALREEAPHFTFRTWKGDATTAFPNPRVNSQWNGECSSPEVSEEDVVDATGEPEPAQTPAKVPAKPAAKPSPVATPAPTAGKVPPKTPGKPPSKPVAAPEPEPEPETPSEDLDALAEVADTPFDEDDEEAKQANEDAGQRLAEVAQEVGLSEDEISSAPNWAGVVELIRAAGSGSDTPTDDTPEPEEQIVDKDEVWFYKPVDAKTKKPVKKAIEVKVMVTNAKAKTADVKNLTDGKTIYKGVKWDDLEQEAS